MPARSELVAYGRNTEEVATAIGADLVIFQTLPDLIASVRQFNPSITDFDCSVFTGHYVTGGVDEKHLQQLERQRADSVKGAFTNGSISAFGVNGDGRSHTLVASEGKTVDLGCRRPMNGADDSVGLYNSWKVNNEHPLLPSSVVGA
jgi:amidophosphoribosyltransferase